MCALVVFLGTLNKQLFICKYTDAGQLIGGQNGCYNLVPVFEWIRRCIISIFLVFFIAFLPLFLQGTLRPRPFLPYYSPFVTRTHREGYRKGTHASRKAFPVLVPDVRGLLHANLHALNSQ